MHLFFNTDRRSVIGCRYSEPADNRNETFEHSFLFLIRIEMHIREQNVRNFGNLKSIIYHK